MSRIAYVNGRFVRHSDAMISIDDRGLQFADSIYEVWLVINGRLVDAQGHWARAQRSLDGLGISGVSLRAVETAICETIRRNHVRTGFVYLQITRGTAGAIMLFQRKPHPTSSSPQSRSTLQRQISGPKKVLQRLQCQISVGRGGILRRPTCFPMSLPARLQSMPKPKKPYSSMTRDT